MVWRAVASERELGQGGKAVVRVDGRQVLILRTERGLYACNNRCPHEGYPLREGSLSDGCILTCNWHNWKFDLESGETLIGGDRLARYPVKADDGRIWIDWRPPDPATLREKALGDLEVALADEDYARIARELARLERHGGDALAGLSRAVLWSHDRFEFGMTHAYAAAADWLALRDRAGADLVRRLSALVEAIAHIGEDADDARTYLFAAATRTWSEPAFLAAIEGEDEAAAVALLRGALADRMPPLALRAAFARAALAHYQDFGHAAIYAVKAAELAERLDPQAAGAVLLSMTRSLVYASREDLLPEFGAYGEALARWRRQNGTAVPLRADEVLDRPAKAAMGVVATWSRDYAPEAIYPVLLDAASRNMLQFDRGYEQRTDGAIADNVGWLDFTHAITFASAARQLAASDARLWPAALLQLACFVGRNAKYVDRGLDTSAWRSDDPRAFFDAAVKRLYDHGVGEFIVAAHQVKTTLAAAAEAEAAPGASPALAAAVGRWLSSPPKRRHALRTARQMREFVAEE